MGVKVLKKNRNKQLQNLAESKLIAIPIQVLITALSTQNVVHRQFPDPKLDLRVEQSTVSLSAVG